MKTGLIMEGGAMRGMFTAGVTDVMMENGIKFDGAIGVSAGAVFGCNYKSNQIGRTIRYNKKYCADKRYCSINSLLKTGDLYNAKFDYYDIPKKLDIFDTEAYKNNPMEFYVVATDADTGKAVYKRLDNCDDNDLLWLRASASMPLLSRIVNIADGRYSDGGTADSVPLRYFESIGYDRNVVILTQPADFIKRKNKLVPIFRIGLHKYPNLVHALATRHIKYNETIKYINEKEKSGEILVIRPPEALNIKAGEKSPDELERVYQIGRKIGNDSIQKIIDFLK